MKAIEELSLKLLKSAERRREEAEALDSLAVEILVMALEMSEEELEEFCSSIERRLDPNLRVLS